MRAVSKDATRFDAAFRSLSLLPKHFDAKAAQFEFYRILARTGHTIIRTGQTNAQRRKNHRQSGKAAPTLRENCTNKGHNHQRRLKRFTSKTIAYSDLISNFNQKRFCSSFVCDLWRVGVYLVALRRDCSEMRRLDIVQPGFSHRRRQKAKRVHYRPLDNLGSLCHCWKTHPAVVHEAGKGAEQPRPRAAQSARSLLFPCPKLYRLHTSRTYSGSPEN